MDEKYPRCTNVLRDAGQYYPRTCQECGLGPCKRVTAAATEAAPAAAGTGIDTSEFASLLTRYASEWKNASNRYENDHSGARAALIAHINAWGAQQREEGRLEMQDFADQQEADAGRLRAEIEQARVALAQRAAGETAAKMPCGATVTNVYEAYEAGKLAARAVGGVDVAKLVRWNRTDDGMQSGPGNDGRFVEFDDVRALLAAAPAAANAGYQTNVLESCANWLDSRSNTVWASEVGCCDLMRGYAADLRSIRSGMLASGATDRAAVLEEAALRCETVELLFDPAEMLNSTKQQMTAITARMLAGEIRKLSDTPAAVVSPAAPVGDGDERSKALEEVTDALRKAMRDAGVVTMSVMSMIKVIDALNKKG